MSKLWSAVVFGIVVAFVSSAFAQDAPKKEGHKHPSPQQIFKKLDKDGNGTLTLAELKANERIKDKAEAIFKRWDANKDGKVCCTEFAKAFAKRHRGGEHKKGEHKKGEHKKGEPK